MGRKEANLFESKILKEMFQFKRIKLYREEIDKFHNEDTYKN
jgi:hypothetical protein